MSRSRGLSAIDFASAAGNLALKAVWLGVCASLSLSPLPARAAFDAAAVFEGKCGTCHTVGRVLVGPDLKGVVARHDRRWLHSFIRSSQTVVRSGDTSAVTLFKKFQRVMPDHPFSDPEIDALLAFIEAGAPSARRGEGTRDGRTATPREIALGRDLFLGRAAFARGGAACVDCHTAGSARNLGGGSLASDLTGVYPRYQDWALHRALQGADFPLMRKVYAERPLTEDEVFAVKAFLQRAPAEPRSPRGRLPFPVAFLGLSSSALVLLSVRRRPRRAEPKADG